MATQQAQTSAPPPAVGARIAGRYVVEQSLGQGGMAEVFRVRDTTNGAIVALKHLNEALALRRPVVGLLFEREYHTLKQLAHPSIVAVHDYGVCEHGQYYTMELLGGDDLLGLAPLPWREACAVLRDVASSLAIVHSRRLLHRDVSPRNVRRSQDGHAKLIDFGAMATMGCTGELIGTPPCMPPEAVHGQPLDARADLYSLGALAYWTLTGTHAYSARTVGALRDTWRSRPRAPSVRVKDIPEALDRLVLALLNLDPLARPVSAAEVIEHLTVIAGLPPDEHAEVARAYLSAPTLLGREAVVLRFRKQLLRCGRGRGGAAIVEAAPGMGRSRLLHAVELEGKLAGAAVLRAKPEPDCDFGVLRALARELLASMPDVALATAHPIAASLAPVLPELRERLGLPEPSPDAAPLDSEIEAAACQWLLALSKRQSLIIAIDDLQRADASSLSLLALLAQHATDHRVLLVLSLAEGSSVSAPLALAALRRKATNVSLTPLNAEHTAQLARSLFGDVPNVTRVAGWMHKLAHGNPRTCMELASHLVDRGIARYQQGGWRLPASLLEHELPTSFENTLEQRLAALSPVARELAHGLALSEVMLTLQEYPLLLDGTDAGAAVAMFGALDELVSAGVLVTRDEAYVFSQGGYVEAARRLLEPELAARLHRRLSTICSQRGDLARKASHLLHAGDEVAALETLAEHHRDTGGYLSPDVPPPVAVRRRTMLQGPIEDTTAAVETRKRLLEACERHAWPERERLMICNGLMLLANQYDSSQMLGYIEPQLASLRRDSGALYWDDFADSPNDAERAQRCLQHAQRKYDATPPGERVLSPYEAVGTLTLTIGIAQTLGRQSHDVRLLQEAVGLADFLASITPGFAGFQLTTSHALELVRGRVDLAASLRARSLAYYEELSAAAKPMLPISLIGRALMFQIEGFERARNGRPDAHEFADKMAGELFPDPAVTTLGAHIWLRRAWEIRRVLHLYNGNAAEARACQEQLDRLSLRHAYAPYGAGAAFFEAQAFALSSDLMGLKQSIEAIGAVVAQQYPGWEPYLHAATGDYHRLRGDGQRALDAYDQVLAATAAGSHPAWIAAACARVEALLELGRQQDALAAAHAVLLGAQQGELGVVAECDCERVLALVEAAVGQTASAAGRAERALDRLERHQVRGIRVGALLEARARVALASDDAEAFAAFATRTAEIYRAGRNPALVAKYERLIESARAADIPLSAELTHAAEISASLGLSDASHGFHTVFETCEDAPARRARALQLLHERTGSKSGFLYAVGDKGSVQLLSAVPDAPPPDDLEGALRAYLQAELDETSDVTVTCFDEAARTSSLGTAAAYQPVLLWDTVEGEQAIVGIAALLCEPEQFSAPGIELLAAVAKTLAESDEVVSILG